MIAEYRLLQFYSDPFRTEAKNVAVVVFEETNVAYQAIGERADGFIDTRYFEALLKERKQDAWVWVEWVEWLRDLVCSRSADYVRKILDELHMRNGQFGGQAGGSVDLGPSSSVTSAAAEIFRDFVGNPTLSPSDSFAQSVDDFFDRLGLGARPDFRRNVEVEFELEGRRAPIIVDFAGLLEAEHRTAFKCIQFRHHATAAAVAQVNDARFTFEQVVELGFLSRERSIVLHDTPSKPRRLLLERLRGYVELVNIDVPQADRRLLAHLGL